MEYIGKGIATLALSGVVITAIIFAPAYTFIAVVGLVGWLVDLGVTIGT